MYLFITIFYVHSHFLTLVSSFKNAYLLRNLPFQKICSTAQKINQGSIFRSENYIYSPPPSEK
jgi:hypothetical protein